MHSFLSALLYLSAAQNTTEWPSQTTTSEPQSSYYTTSPTLPQYPPLVCISTPSQYYQYGGLYIIQNATEINGHASYFKQGITSITPALYILSLLDTWVISESTTITSIASAEAYCNETAFDPSMCTTWLAADAESLDLDSTNPFCQMADQCRFHTLLQISSHLCS